MSTALIDGFADELMKLAVGDVNPDPEDPNYPWRADTTARGIKETAKLPSVVPSGQLGDAGRTGKSSTEPGPRERTDVPDVQTGIE